MNVKKFCQIKKGGFFRGTIDDKKETGVFMKISEGVLVLAQEKRVNAVALISEQPSIWDSRGELWMFGDDAPVVEYSGKIDFERVD